MKKIIFIGLFMILATLINLNFILAEGNISLDYPSEIDFGDEFEVELSLQNFTDDIYDVKIDITKEEERVAEIWDGSSWQSTFNYVTDAIDFSSETIKSFKLNITQECSGSLDIEVKIRNSVESSEVFSGYTINVRSFGGDDDDDDDDSSDESEIDLEMNWDEDDIINGEEFKIELSAEGLGDKEYDIKVWIEDDDENVISDRYDSKNKEWKSGAYYVDEFLEGSGDDNRDIKLRIREDYRDLEGDFEIFFKIRGEIEIDEYIEILEEEEEADTNEEEEEEESENEDNDDTPDVYEDYQAYILEQAKEFEEKLSAENSIDGNVIRLGKSKSIEKSESEDIKTENTIYKSKSELIKTYAIIFFALLCLVITVLLAFDKLKN